MRNYHLRANRRGAWAGLVLAAMLVTPGAATASIGAGVGAAPLTLGAPAHPGWSYTVHWLYVKNTGTAPSDYLVKVERLSGGSAKRIPVDWVRVAPVAFHLRPRAIERVTVTVAIPRAAGTGAYMTDLVATTFAPHRGGGTALGAAAADRLSFTIPSTSSFPWFWIIVAAAVAAVLGAIYSVRRSGVRLRLDRARASA